MKETNDKPQLSPDHFALYGTSGFYATYDLAENEKAKTRFIQGIEQIVRSSYEYSNFIKYLKTEAKLVYCDVLQGIDEETMKNLSLEMHHYPFTLYDITDAVLMKYVLNGRDFTRLSIANEVMDLHYSLQVGLVPLTVTVHQLAHSGGIMVDIDHIFGDYKRFAEEYKLYIADTATARLKVYESKSRNKAWIKNNNRKTLEFNGTLFDLDYKPPQEIEEQEAEPTEKAPWDPRSLRVDMEGDF